MDNEEKMPDIFNEQKLYKVPFDADFTEDDFNNMLIDLHVEERRRQLYPNLPSPLTGTATTGKTITITITKANHYNHLDLGEANN